MAELDDFFAKKDRKKPKNKKFATTEELAKKLEDTSKKIDVKTKRDRTNATNPDGDESNNMDQINEDEWKDFEEDDGHKDYSNLKIGQLTINEEEQNQVNMGHDGELGYDGQSDGEGNSDNTDRRPGPWKKVANTDGVVEQQPPPTSQKSTSNVYISPALRNQMAQNQRAGRLRNRIAPDLANEEYFPTLGTTTKQEQTKKKIDANFEEVKHGGRAHKTSDLPSNAPVTIGNRFNSLDDNSM